MDEGENEQQVLVAETDSMSWFSKMETDLGGSAVAAHNGSFYIFGGETDVLDIFNDVDGEGVNTIWRIDVAPAGPLMAQATEVTLPMHAKGSDTWAGATATNIGDGQILIAGGSPWMAAVGDEVLYEAFIFNAIEETIGPLFELVIGRTVHQAVSFTNGDVALIGGLLQGGNAATSVELYRPETGLLETGEKHSASMPAAASLAAGEILICGGYNGSGSNATPSSTCEILTINGKILPAASLPAARDGLTLSSVGEGRVLATGGADSTYGAHSNAWLYDQLSDNWISVGSLNVPRALHRAVALPNGSVLILGGATAAERGVAAWEGGPVGQSISCVELYDPESQEFQALKDCTVSDDAVGLPERSLWPSVGLDPEHGVLVVGGFDSVGNLPAVSGVSFFPAAP
jgi:hypothetical protein